MSTPPSGASRPRARLRPDHDETQADRSGAADATNAAYVEWLKSESMLRDATAITRQFAGLGAMWRNSYALPDPEAAITMAPVWFTAYPPSLITKPGASFLETLADPGLWGNFEEIGINAVHTGPVKRAGGLDGWESTPSVDGHFDRISTRIDAAFGTEEQFRRMCEVAAQHGGVIIDDIVPGHTGKGADFRLAEMGVEDYPGIFHMVAIDEADWHLLPQIPDGCDSANLDEAAETALADAGYIIGPLQRVIFWDPGVKDTNWSATRPVPGPDGVVRRWVYLHYFKEGQPSINWLDPTFAGVRLVIGDALHSLGDLGAGGLRLDANGFLGVERRSDGRPAWSEGHPLSEAANHLIASMVRKVGGFTFQELNLTIDDIRSTSVAGADLSYDFINRPAYHHALATADTEFLRLTLNASLAHGVEPKTLVHALQNHDELTYELVHFATLHAEDEFSFRGATVRGADLAEQIRGDLLAHLTGPQRPYNQVFTTNGIASTTATVIAGALGIESLDDIGPDDIERIRDAHLALAMFNALQPGVFALSGWDLTGALTLDPDLIPQLLATGDTRWIHRSAYDLMGYADPDSPSRGMPHGRCLYGSLPEQLADPGSFASRLREILRVRAVSGLATATQLDVPPVSQPSLLAMVHRLSDGDTQVTIINFGPDHVAGRVQSTALSAGSGLIDMFTGSRHGIVDADGALDVNMRGFAGLSLRVAR